MRLTLALSVLFATHLFAGDDRIGTDTHFDQAATTNFNIGYIPSFIASGGFEWIRDDGNWALDERSAGVYTEFPEKQAWIDAVAKAGLKTVWVLGQVPNFYGDGNLSWPKGTETDKWAAIIPAAAKFCAWLAVTEGPKIAAIEVTNEPNNLFQSQVGSNWERLLVKLTTAIHDAVHAVSPGTMVIGYGGQGSQILDMLRISQDLDGVVYHPYSDRSGFPERTYEPPYTDYQTWVSTLKAATKLPIWETEWAGNAGGSENYSAIFDARRLLMTLWEGVAHTFIYLYCASDPTQSIIDYHQNPRQNYYVIQRIMALLPPKYVGSSQTVGVTSADPKFDLTHFKGLTFQDGTYATAAAVWFGNVPHFGPIGTRFNLMQTAELTVYHPNAVTVIATDLLSGSTSRPAWTQTGNNVVIHNANVSVSPVLYKIYSGVVP